MGPLQAVSNRNEETNDKHFSFVFGSMVLKSLKGTAKALMTLGVSFSYFPFCLFNSRDEKKNDPGKELEGSDKGAIGTPIHFWREVIFCL